MRKITTFLLGTAVAAASLAGCGLAAERAAPAAAVGLAAPACGSAATPSTSATIPHIPGERSRPIVER